MIGRPLLRLGRPSLLQPAARTAPVPPASGSPASPPTPAALGATGINTNELINQFRELGRLRDQGVLTDEEFATQKARLLNQ